MPTATATKPAAFPTKPYTRCGGTGQYSFCTMYGTVCFKCCGTGHQYATRKVEAAAAAYRAAVKDAKQRMAQDLTVGVQVLDTLGYEAKGGEKWTTIVDIAVTPEACGWCSTDGAPVRAWAFYVWVTLDNGTVKQLGGNSTIRTRSMGVDKAPFLAMAGVKA